MNPKILYPAVITLIALAIYSGTRLEPHHEFQQWCSKFGFSYSSDQYVYRLNIFKQELLIVEEHNIRYQKGEETYQKGINQFSAMTNTEFSSLLSSSKGAQESNFVCSNKQPPSTNVPASFDWSAKGALTSVTNLDKCSGASYAVVAAETISAGRFITTGTLVGTSSMQIIQCSQTKGNKGCDGGNILNSFQYALQKGLTNSVTYPFVDQKSVSACKYDSSKKQWQLLGCVKVTPQNQTTIKAAVFHQPVAAVLDTNGIKNYKSGVYTESLTTITKCKTNFNHWMTLVGYGVDGKNSFWKLRNNIGTSWGQQGYLRIQRSASGNGLCGVQSQLYYPLD